VPEYFIDISPSPPLSYSHIKCINYTVIPYYNGGTIMALVKKTIELDQDVINRIKMALNAKTEKEAINTVLKQFDTDILLSEITFKDAGTFNFEGVFED